MGCQDPEQAHAHLLFLPLTATGDALQIWSVEPEGEQTHLGLPGGAGLSPQSAEVSLTQRNKFEK